MRVIKQVIFILLAGIIFSACTTTPPPLALTPVTIQFSWFNSAQFAGFYAADQNGDYTREGLKVTFVEGGPTVDMQTPVLNGTAQFGILGGDVLIAARAAGKPFRAVATIFRRAPFVFFSLADSGINKLEDFVGKKVMVRPGARPRFHAMLARINIAPDQVTEVSDAVYTDLYTHKVDVAYGYVTDEVLRAQEAGYKLNLIYPDDYGVHFYADTLFTTDDFIAANPDIVTRFLRATFQGWTYAVENSKIVGPMVLKYKPDIDPAFESAEIVASLPFVNTGEDHIGWMNPEIWAGMLETLRGQGSITTPLDPTDVYTMQFIQQIYAGGSE